MLETPSLDQTTLPIQYDSGGDGDQLNGALQMVVSGNTAGAWQHSGLREEGEGDMALPERLLASQGMYMCLVHDCDHKILHTL